MGLVTRTIKSASSDLAHFFGLVCLSCTSNKYRVTAVFLPYGCLSFVAMRLFNSLQVPSIQSDLRVVAVRQFGIVFFGYAVVGTLLFGHQVTPPSTQGQALSCTDTSFGATSSVAWQLSVDPRKLLAYAH
eukprot:2679391-Rhodomonas_salina.1